MSKGLKKRKISSRIKYPTLLVGLPGIGNVGKIVTDFLIEQLNAKEIKRFNTDAPPMVFPTEHGIEFPSVRLYHVNYRNKNFLFLAGDYQPRDSKCFEFCHNILEFFKKLKGKEIIILGGASLPIVGKNPDIYVISNNENLLKRYKKIYPNLKPAYGNLGPIVGVAGVLLGLAKDKKIDAATFLTETTEGEYFNSISVRKALELVNKLTGIKVDTKKFDLKIKSIGAEINAIKSLSIQSLQQDKFQEFLEEEKKEEESEKNVNYIG